MRRLLPVLAVLLLMVLAQRLLPSTSGAGGFAPPATVPPFDNSWSRSGSNPVLSPVVAWEQTAVQEADITYESGTWKMWYRGGWDDEAIGYATSSDGIAWTKYASNPVYGLGGSGEAASVALPEVLKVGSTYYLFAVKHPFGIGGTNVTVVATSTDGIAWTTQASSLTLPSGKTLWGNCTVWIEGSTWYRLQEAGPTPWEVYLFSSPDGLAWTVANSGSPLTTLQVAAGGMYGGATFATNSSGILTPKFGSLYHVWYHASPVSGNLPTNIYHATSPDKITWTQTGAVLTHSGSGFEVDQVADPSVIVVGGTAYLFYDGDDNTSEVAKIGVATAAAGY